MNNHRQRFERAIGRLTVALDVLESEVPARLDRLAIAGVAPQDRAKINEALATAEAEQAALLALNDEVVSRLDRTIVRLRDLLDA